MKIATPLPIMFRYRSCLAKSTQIDSFTSSGKEVIMFNSKTLEQIISYRSIILSAPRSIAIWLILLQSIDHPCVLMMFGRRTDVLSGSRQSTGGNTVFLIIKFPQNIHFPLFRVKSFRSIAISRDPSRAFISRNNPYNPSGCVELWHHFSTVLYGCWQSSSLADKIRDSSIWSISRQAQGRITKNSSYCSK